MNKRFATTDWFRVEERLPGENVNLVLVTHHPDDGPPVTWLGERFEDGSWADPEGNKLWVSHWQPLPAPATDDEDGIFEV